MKKLFPHNAALIASCLLLTFSLRVAAEHFRVTPITQKDGLPNNLISDIKKDNEGYLWIVSNQGLSRFDGKQWKTHHYESNNPHSISSNNTSALYIDLEDHIWVGTRKNGINKFNKKTSRFETYLPEASITSITGDNDQSLWIGTLNDGVYRLSRNGKLIKHYLPHTQINHITKINDKIFVGVEQSGLLRLDNNQFTPLVTLNTYDVLSANNSLESFWLATNSGLYLHNPKNNSTLQYLDKFWVTKINYRTQNELWVATENSGLILFDLSNKSIKQHFKSNNSPVGPILDNHIKTLLIDNQEIAWVGSAGGINKIVSKPFKTFRHSSITDNGTANNYIRDFAEDRDGNIWIGSWGGGISKLSPQNSGFTNYPSNFNLALRIAKIIYDQNTHSLWVASDSGLNIFDINLITWEKNILNNKNISISTITKTRNGHFLLSTRKNGLFIVDSQTHKILKHYTHNPADKNSLLHNTVNHAIEIHTGELLVSTVAGLNILNLDTETFSTFSNFNSAAHKNILYAMEDRKNKIWLNIDGVLHTLNRNLNNDVSVQSLNEQLCMDLNIVSTILEDPLGYLWFSSEENIYRYNPDNNSVLSFDQADNLPYESGTERAQYISSNNELYITNTSGFVIIDPYNVQPSKLNPPVKIHTIKIDGAAHTDIESVQLSNSHSNVEFQFASLDYKDPDKNLYAHRLEGLEKDWVYSGNNNVANYSNLPSGNYTFLVKASNSDGQWSNNIASVDIIAAPTTTPTLWKYGLFIISLLSLLSAYGIIRNRRLVARAHKATDSIAPTQDPLEKTHLADDFFEVAHAHLLKGGLNKTDPNNINDSKPNNALNALIARNKNGHIAAKESKFLKQLNNCVSANYHDPKFGIKHVSNELHTTERPLQKKLKAMLGMTLTRYIRLYRLEQAAELLRNNHDIQSKPLHEMVGFSSQAYFITCFKAHFNTTPSLYLQELHKPKSP